MDGSVARDHLVTEMGDGFAALDADGRFVDVNDAFLAVVGADRETVLASTLEAVLGDTCAGAVRVAIEDLRGGAPEEPIRLAETLETAGGDRREVDLTLSRCTDDEGGFRGVVCVLRDVGEVASATNEIRQAEELLELTGEGAYALDVDGRFTYTTDAMLGYDQADLLGEHASSILTPESAERGREVIRDLVTSDARERATYEMEVIASDGERIQTENNVAIRTTEAGEFVGSVGVVRDISRHKRRDRDLERYEQLVQAMGDGVYALDADGRYTMINDYLLEKTGYERSAVIGEHAALLHADAEIEVFQGAIQSLLDTDEDSIETVESTIQTSDGEEVPIEVNLTLLPSDDGAFRGSVGVVRDITERKRRERELERYARLIEASGDAVYALDTDGRFTFSNEAHQEIVARPESEILGEHARSCLPAKAVENGRRLIQDLIDSGRRCGTYEMDVLRPDGERVPTENHVALLTDEDGTFRGTVGVLRDISERNRRERELRRQNERLERFASIVSHDLRNPLNVAHGYVDLLEGNEEALGKVQHSLERMDAIIEDVLELARQGRTIDERERVDLQDVVAAAWATVRTGAATLQNDADGTVLADGGRLTTVFENLFRNSLEHGGEGVTVTVGALEDGDGFYVADDGVGIPPEDRDAVLEMGYTTGENGTGFGLAIVTEIAEAHGWSVSIETSDEGGARFEFRDVDWVG